jgi:hypothetical protein
MNSTKPAPDTFTALEAHQHHVNRALGLVDEIRANLQARFDEAETAQIHWGHAGTAQKAEGLLNELADVLGLD